MQLKYLIINLLNKNLNKYNVKLSDLKKND